MRTPNTNECNINICTKSHNIEGPNRRLTLKQYRASAIDRELAIPWVPRQPQFHVLIAGTRNIFMGSSGDSTLRFGGFLKMLILYCVRVGGPHGRIGRSRKGMRWPLLQPRPLASNCPEWGLLKMTTCACRGQRLRFWRAPSGKAPVASHAAARRIPRHERDALVRMLGESVALASARALCSRRAVARLCVPHISRAPSPDASRRQPPPPPEHRGHATAERREASVGWLDSHFEDEGLLNPDAQRLREQVASAVALVENPEVPQDVGAQLRLRARLAEGVEEKPADQGDVRLGGQRLRGVHQVVLAVYGDAEGEADVVQLLAHLEFGEGGGGSRE